jgi:hypothetical protein
VSDRTQQELFEALGKSPDEIFPLRFSADPRMATGTTEGQVDGLYRRNSSGIHVGFVAASSDGSDNGSIGPTWFQMGGRGGRGYPQPEKNFDYLRIGYAGTCFRMRNI